MGLILKLHVHSASVQDREAAQPFLESCCEKFPSVRKIWADGGYAGGLVAHIAALRKTRQVHLEIVKRHIRKGFEVLPRRWVVERTFAWLLQSRRFARDYEVKTSHSESLIYLSMTKRMLRRIA